MASQVGLRARLSKLLVVLFALVLLITGLAPSGLAQSGTNPLFLFKNYFVTGDYLVSGWVEGAPDGTGFAPGTISIPDTKQPSQPGVPDTVPAGADIVAAYLYWATVEGNQSSFAGKQAFFNGYPITGAVLGNPNAPTSWSSGGCSGSSNGSKTMRTYRADVHAYLPVDSDQSSANFGGLLTSAPIPVRLADSGSNGNTQPNALGATLVLIYRVLNPQVPVNAIVLYDGAFAPSNTGQTISQTITGFYQPAVNPVVKLTHIVANGQPNKGEQVYLNNTSQPLPSLYPPLPPFPGIYGTWDNPTWLVTQFPGYVKNTDTSETTLVAPSLTNSGCVSWGAMVLSTTVQDQDNDGLLDVWENNQGYLDVVRENDPPNGQNDPTSGQWVSLPGANPGAKDLFVELDYLSDLDGSAGLPKHSHLPKQAALDAVGQIFANQGINVHFDLGPGTYQGDSYVISYPVPNPSPLPPNWVAPQPGTGGNAISEGSLLCTDAASLCAFPGQPAIGWKGDFVALQNNTSLGNFQPGRGQSYHYMFLGHSLAAPRSFWSTAASPIDAALGTVAYPELQSIVVTSATVNNATITLQSPSGFINPGDCSSANPPAACSTDLNTSRLTLSGALGQPTLNGTYSFSAGNVAQIPQGNGVTETMITTTISNVAPGTYTFSNEPQLGMGYMGPTSSSGHSDFGGGGDSAITLGLWGTDDPAGCQPDPTRALVSGQVYCNNEVGTLKVEIGTLLHELGHTLTLTHGGTYYNDATNPSLPTYDLNCKPNFLSTMNYLFQVRGFVDSTGNPPGFDFSSQTMPPLNEAFPALSESVGIGSDIFTGLQALHLTRWYSAPNPTDVQLQATTGGRYATLHCDGSPLFQGEPPSVRVDGVVASGGSFSAPLDWNNDFVAPDSVLTPGEDLNHNGIPGDAPFSGFDDWSVLTGGQSIVTPVALQQIGARANAFGSSGGGTIPKGGGTIPKGGGTDDDGGGTVPKGGGTVPKGGGTIPKGGGVDQDEDTATSTVDAPAGLTCKAAVSGVPACTGSSSPFLENGKKVPLTWTPPDFGQIRFYYVWRAVGSFPTVQSVAANIKLFSKIQTLSGSPPSPSTTDSNVKNGVTYTYFVTDQNKQGAVSGASSPLVVTVKF
jgi:hypothetical protein